MAEVKCRPYKDWKGTEANSALDGVWCTYQQLVERMECVQYYSQPWISSNMGTPVPNRWSDVYSGIDLWLESQYLEQWEELEKDDEGCVYVEENDYLSFIESHVEDYGMADVYENGMKSLYAWMVGAVHSEIHDFMGAVREYMEERELPIPGWVTEDEMCYFTDEEED